MKLKGIKYVHTQAEIEAFADAVEYYHEYLRACGRLEEALLEGPGCTFGKPLGQEDVDKLHDAVEALESGEGADLTPRSKDEVTVHTLGDVVQGFAIGGDPRDIPEVEQALDELKECYEGFPFNTDHGLGQTSVYFPVRKESR